MIRLLLGRRLLIVGQLVWLSCVISPASGELFTLWDHGPSRNRVDMVFLGDGYTTADLETAYPAHIQNALAHIFQGGEDPFPRYRKFFNVHRINIASTESGADNPGVGVYRDTALDATYYGDGVNERSLQINNGKALLAMTRQLIGTGITADVRMVTVNSSLYGGTGGLFATYAGGNYAAAEVALHEIGHSFGNLADEYTYGGAQPRYDGAEPSAPNVSLSPHGEKWAHWLGYHQPGIGTIDVYEGAYYHEEGIYRPSFNSKMRALHQPFDAVSREQLILSIYDFVDPLDDWLATDLLLTGADMLWVLPIDPEVIKLQWYVDGILIAGATGDSFRLTDYGYGRGTYEVRALAYDDTEWVRIQLEALRQDIYWNVVIVPETGALGLFSLGVVGLGYAGWRKKVGKRRLDTQ